MVQENLDRNAYAEAGQATEADIKLNALEQEITHPPDPGRAQSKDKLIKEARAIIEAADASAARFRNWNAPSPASRPRKSPRSARSARSFSPRGIQEGEALNQLAAVQEGRPRREAGRLGSGGAVVPEG